MGLVYSQDYATAVNLSRYSATKKEEKERDGQKEQQEDIEGKDEKERVFLRRRES
jgi:hypothetical protein